MLDETRIEAYRRMTPEERWVIVEELMSLAWRSLLDLPNEERQRRLDIAREEHDLSDANIISHLRRFP